jgi:UDP-N-acetylmuramate: L-alanyl-gamma-D-glutamyl-meso-diaminopimelate ligase
MRMGVHRETLGPSLKGADEVWLYTPPDLGWDAATTVAVLRERAHLVPSIEALVTGLQPRLKSGDHVLIMSNGAFGGLHERLLEALRGARGDDKAERG